MSCAYPIGLGIVLGGGLGYALSRGLCAGGGCPITSNRALMVLIGAFFGGWLALSGCSRGAGGKAETAPADAGGEVTTPEQFAGRVVEAGTPALVDFYADRCRPCRELAPILTRLEAEYAGRVSFFRVDVEEARELASQHRIRYLPTLVLYRGGKQVGRIEGRPSESNLRRRLDDLAKGD